MTIRHSVVVVTYNQESMIGECLDSILGQSVLPYEVIVADDCSTDGTWNIVQQYITKYPKLIRAIRNERNKGVFGNFNQVIRVATGDFINFVAGDDMLPEGILAAYNAFIEEHNLDCNNSFSIYTNTLVLRPNGSTYTLSNSQVLKVAPERLVLLSSWYVWITGLSRGLLCQLPTIREDIGYKADWLFNIERIRVTETHYYMDVLGYIYREGVGVTNASRKLSLYESRKKTLEIIQSLYPELFDKYINAFLAFETAYLSYQIHPTCSYYWKLVLTRVQVHHLPVGNPYRHNLRILVPYSVKRLIRRLIT